MYSGDVSPTTHFYRRAPFGVEKPTLLAYAANVLLQLANELHLHLALSLEWILSAVHTMLCVVFFWRWREPLPSRPPEISAVVITGGGEGIGRVLSLKFASVGYTVFACLPHDIPTPTGTRYTSSSSASSASSLLWIWQSRKARRQGQDDMHLRGSIVPLVFDASSYDDCERAWETIQAYCAQHSVSLTTIVIPPTSPFSNSRSGTISPVASSSFLGGPSSPSSFRPPPRGKRSPASIPIVQMSQTNLHDAMSRTVFHPVAIVQALAGMLQETKGQVIWLSGCGESSFNASHGVTAICDTARARTAETLRTELAPFDISVTHVSMGPLQKRAAAAASLGSDESRTRKYGATLSLLWAIDERTIFDVVRAVVESRYPRATMRFGLDSFAQNAWNACVPSQVSETLWSVASRALREGHDH